MDAVFGPGQFLNEVIWQRTGAHNSAGRYGRVTDTLLFYARSASHTWNAVYTPYAPEYIEERYHYKDSDGRLFWPNQVTGAGI